MKDDDTAVLDLRISDVAIVQLLSRIRASLRLFYNEFNSLGTNMYVLDEITFIESEINQMLENFKDLK